MTKEDILQLDRIEVHLVGYSVVTVLMICERLHHQ